MNKRTVKSQATDAVELAVYEAGDPRGASIVFIHGFSQSHLSWAKQFADAGLQRQFHLVAFDLRGHGDSGKPLTAQAYRDSRLWADDLKSVIDAVCARPPCLVGWSYAGRVINDYLALFGDSALSAINFVDATSTADPAVFGAAAGLMRPMTSEDADVAAQAVMPFLHACFAQQPSDAELQEMARFNNQTPAQVRRFMSGRPTDYDAVLAKVKVPVLVTHGELDAVMTVAMGEHTARQIPHARLSLYAGTGHSPFYEQPVRFNAELTALMGDAWPRGNAQSRIGV
jgi:non-heme chloroperoxidase